jgi:H+/Cl- antiporter ClcA
VPHVTFAEEDVMPRVYFPPFSNWQHGDIIVGLIGAFIGNWFVRALHFSVNLGSPVADRIVVSVVGAVLLMLIIGLLRPRSLRERFTNVWRR